MDSHIIPETFWKSIYDDQHHALPLSMDQFENRFISKGLREKLLCVDCESKLSKWETTLKRDLVDIGEQKSNYLKITSPARGITLVQGIRYADFKLAVLSILWRMSIASIPFFSEYGLGKYEEVLRNAIYNERALPEKAFPILIARYELNGVFNPGFIMGFPPGKRDSLFTIQQFMIWGHLFSVVIAYGRFPAVPIEIFLRESGQIFVQTRNVLELASPTSALSRIFDPRVKAFFEKGKKTQT